MRTPRNLCLACVALLGLCASFAGAQTVRFETSVGSFDMVLNPTNNANLQPYVDNILAYVGTGRYHYTAINRAADQNNSDPSDDFVLQMGGFLGFPRNPQLWSSTFPAVDRFNSLVVDNNGDGQVDFDTTGLTNTRGTVSFALAAGNVNSATSSFFVNLNDSNTFLDAQGFVPFAEVEDMSTIDTIMQLMQQDLQPGSGNLAQSDVPLLDNGQLVILQRVFLVDRPDGFSFVGPILNATGQGSSSASASSASATGLASSIASSAGGSASSAASAFSATPEPSAALLLLSALGFLTRRRR